MDGTAEGRVTSLGAVLGLAGFVGWLTEEVPIDICDCPCNCSDLHKSISASHFRRSVLILLSSLFNDKPISRHSFAAAYFS